MRRLPLAALALLIAASPPPTGRPDPRLANAFGDLRVIEIVGYDGDAMEPFITKDGAALFFNNSNAPGVNTDLFWATRIDDTHFRFAGPLRGANTPALDAVASMDDAGSFYFTTMRSYDKDLLTLYSGHVGPEGVTGVRAVQGGFARRKPGWVTMDAEISEDGQSLYYSDAHFGSGGAAPDISRIGFARRGLNGEFTPVPGSDRLLGIVNAGNLTYAPSISADGLELFYTKLDAAKTRTTIYHSVRKTLDEPFGLCFIIPAITGNLTEAPSLSRDGRTLYFHRKDGNRFRLYRVTRAL